MARPRWLLCLLPIAACSSSDAGFVGSWQYLPGSTIMDCGGTTDLTNGRFEITTSMDGNARVGTNCGRIDLKVSGNTATAGPVDCRGDWIRSGCSNGHQIIHYDVIRLSLDSNGVLTQEIRGTEKYEADQCGLGPCAIVRTGTAMKVEPEGNQQ
jgi:hypothetical protein